MYRTNFSGSTKDVNGVFTTWNASDLVVRGKGDLDHVQGVEWDLVEAEEEERAISIAINLDLEISV